MERTHQTKHLGSFWSIVDEKSMRMLLEVQFMLCYADATFGLWKVSL